MKRESNESKENRVLIECLKEMFSRVGEEYPNRVLTDNSDWYRLRSWTKRQEKDFEYWMKDYLRKNLKLNKKTAIIRVSQFLLIYGWTKIQKLPLIKVIVK